MFLPNPNSPIASRISAGTAVHGSGARSLKVNLTTIHASAALTAAIASSDHGFVGCI